MTCPGGGVIPDWLPDWLYWAVAGSQGMTTCGIEWLMFASGLIVFPLVLACLARMDATTPS